MPYWLKWRLITAFIAANAALILLSIREGNPYAMGFLGAELCGVLVAVVLKLSRGPDEL